MVSALHGELNWLTVLLGVVRRFSSENTHGPLRVLLKEMLELVYRKGNAGRTKGFSGLW